MINQVFGRGYDIWRHITKHSINNTIADLNYPTYGNQCGAYIDGHFTGAGSFVNNIYGTIAQSLLSDIERLIVADLGGGYGKFGFFTLRHIPKSTFIDFDLPETLCVAAYYLIKTWPNKSALLYGEANYDSSAHRSYDLIFMPNFEIQKVDSESVNLFLNKNSLGEMTKDCVEHYLMHMYRATQYLFHMNHESIRRMGENSLRADEYPMLSNFKKIVRFPALYSTLVNGKIDFSDDIFFYLMERCR